MMRSLVLVVFLVACADDGGEQSDCEISARKACMKACACPNPDGKCRIGDSQFTFSFDNEDKCLDFYFGQGCSMANPGVDFAKCKVALDSAVCVADSTITGAMRLDQPGACEVGGGP